MIENNEENITTLNLSKWGNSMAIRLPKDVLKRFDLTEHDELILTVRDDQMILTPKKKTSKLDQLFENFDLTAYRASLNPEEPNEIDWGESVGKEIF